MRRVALFVVLGVIVAACGPAGSQNLRAQLASHPAGIGAGQQRVLIALIDIDSNQVVDVDDPVTATLRDRNGSPLADYPGEFVWIVPDVRGMYAFHMEIPEAGDFQVTLSSTSFAAGVGPIRLTARAETPVVRIGDAAPLSMTRTIPEYDLRDITSDPDPEPGFYQKTVAEAVGSGPSVIVFGTPAWCTSQACGPMLAQVRRLAPEFPWLNFVHVEVYEDIHVSSVDSLTLVPAVTEWGLVSEPVIFVTDSRGIVASVFEGAASDGELRRAFEAVSP